MWNANNGQIEDKLQIVIDNIGENKSTSFPESCPICNEKDVHLYFNSRGLNKIGGIWIWCSACKHYFHGSIIPPIWWENCIEVPESNLTAAPDVLESMKPQIDNHVNALLKHR